MVFGWYSERSTYHTTMVHRVHAHLKRMCSEADYERSLISNRITDAFGYDKKNRTWYLCEVKVNPSDLMKSVVQIHDTAFRFKSKQPNDKILPVVCIPAKLHRHLIKTEEWGSFRSLCNNQNISIWVIEQSSVSKVLSPKVKKGKATSRKQTAKTTTAKKATAKSTTAKKVKTKATTAKKAKTKATTTKKAKVTTAKKATSARKKK